MSRKANPATPPNAAVLMGIGLLLAAGCAREPETKGPGTVRLVEVFDSAMVIDAVAVQRDLEPLAQWRFDGARPEQGEHRATFGWRALAGVSGLRVEEGRLVGTATDEVAVLYVEHRGPPPGEDQLHSVKIGLKVAAGDTVGAALVGSERFDEERAVAQARDMSAPLRAEISASDDVVAHELLSHFAIRASRLRHFVLTLHGASDQEFAIDEVRLVTDREHLAGISSGPGWQGLTDIYRETLVARSPERLRLPVAVPAHRPWLDLEVGTPESWPVRFVARVAAPGAAPEEGTVVADRLVTTPHRWETLAVDLTAHAGQEVLLDLALEAEDPGILGYWGSPVVRSRDPSGATPQGVILILADTLRPDHLDAFGYHRETSPTSSRLAAEGARFTDVVAQGTWTKVSVPSIVTSLVPTSHRIAQLEDRLSDTAVTLAELYRDAGYATAAFSSVMFTGKLTNLQQGYDVLHERSSVEIDCYPSKTARVYVDRAMEWIELRREVPFFVFLHLFDPHDPFKPRPPDDVRWGDPAAEERHRQWQEGLREVIEDPLMRNFGMPTLADLERAGIDPEEYVALNVDWYDGSIRGLDSEIARLVAHLEEAGLAERVLLAFTSDHGEEFLEHGRTFHGQSVYGDLAQVPLFFWGPRWVPAGRAVDETVRTIDIMPTLLEISGIDRPPFLQGQSLVPLFGADGNAREGRGWRPAPALVEKAEASGMAAPPPRDTESFAIVSGGWKLIHNTVRHQGTPEHELFDHRADPLNLHDLAADHPEVVESLAVELQKLLAWSRERRLPETERAEDLTAAERERLRALGYLQ